jgi:RNA polymerase sigma-70 factor (ECF subfamily)
MKNTATVEKDNAYWLRVLGEDGPESRAALSELSALLKRNLARSVGRRRGVDDATLEDFVQEALIKITRHRDRFRGDSRFTTWATAIAVRTALTALRRAHWQDVSLDELVLDQLESGVVAPTQEGDAQRKEIFAALHDQINRALTPRQREAILGLLAGVPQEIMARRLGIRRNALYKLEHDARQKLRAALAQKGFQADDIRAID